MAYDLVIVESPAKAKTINKYLGRQFRVKSSVGHIRDLPKGGGGRPKPPDAAAKARAAAATEGMTKTEKVVYKAGRDHQTLIRRMGVDPEHGWQARYEVLPEKEKVLDELRQLAADADTIYLATDLDREGEAIAWHLREVIGGAPERFRRVTFSEITKRAIQAAFADPGDLNMARVNAQQARRFLDRVVGYMVSPVLWKRVARGLSAGRVQSVAVRLVVEREREIRAFVPEEYWDLHADLDSDTGARIRAQVVQHGERPFRPGSRAVIDQALTALRPADYVVSERKDKPTRSRPSAPFITSTLQQSASVRLGFSVSRTMTLAQRLYEAGLITYMRTDATALSADAVQACRGHIAEHYGDDYLPPQPRIYTSKESAQEAHEAIRPTDVRSLPSFVQDRLEADQARLYELIWRQFVACQMPDATFDTSSIDIAAGDYRLRARGRVLRFDGWLKVLPPQRKKGDEDIVLPDLQVGDRLRLIDLDPSQHFTKPPARFNEASLVRELEKRGIGRPSTYAAIISTIQKRGYVRLQNKRLYAEKMGEIVTDRLAENFTGFMEYHFTADLEQELDRIAEGQLEWREVLDQFYSGFKKRLERAEQEMRANQPVPVPDVPCPECTRPMAVRTAKTGVFLSCTGYGLPKKEKPCKQTINLMPGDDVDVVTEADDETMEVDQLRHKRRCPLCQAAMDRYLIDEGRRLHVCGNNPDCPGVELETGSFKIKGYEGPVLTCDKCASEMQLRDGRFGKYFACTAEDCSNTRKLLRNGEPAPPKIDPVPFPELPCTKDPDDHFLLRDGAAGLFFAASSYPRVRETRNPLVRELHLHADEIPVKYRHLLDAPQEDPDGNPTVVRFARKSKEHYVASEKDGKPTKWTAQWVDGRWQVSEKAPQTKRVNKKKS